VIEVRTFLRNPDGTFGQLSESSAPPKDPWYVEGAIELVVDGVEVCGQAQWDLVDQLWAYICTMLEEFRTQDRVSTNFPDMPVELVFERLPAGRVLVTCAGSEVRRAATGEGEFVRALSSAARSALEQLSALLPSNSAGYEDALRRLGK
jgi:hypothetical protein